MATTPQNGNTTVYCYLSRRNLVSELFQHIGAGTHKSDSRRLQAFGKISVLRQEAITGVNRIAAMLDGDLDDATYVQVGRHASGRKGYGCISPVTMQTGCIVFRVDA